jgi:hypothetical protein
VTLLATLPTGPVPAPVSVGSTHPGNRVWANGTEYWFETVWVGWNPGATCPAADWNPPEPVTVVVYRGVTFQIHLAYACLPEVILEANGTEPDQRMYTVGVGAIPAVCPPCWIYRTSPDHEFAVGAWGGPPAAWSPGRPVPPIEARVLVRV